ncbi:alkaline phosphatase PhoX [Novosphingobium sp.]|jgi:secreted PhoX family phosphatase|uniref:alkaline phosphatase PhoX n=1 Tax=Novosphingobium sp. TaxID=1874826 RepID=UPI001EBFEDCF|nr:alkaline phosphatase PhoX [Novosphingobium sp.]MBK6800562.1 DUF839 domain-containing protein [Novosphingobium sp.]MBK9010643.1 DUF839 domain-containing protein [Novosphingobium sp.]
MSITRRQFGLGSVAAMAFAGYAQRSTASLQGPTYRNEIAGYGDLLPDPAGFLDLPRGFTYQVISSAGEAMEDGFIVPDNFDGMGCFALPGGKLALVRNHELGVNAVGKGPTGGDARREARLAGRGAYDRAASGLILPGGTSTVIYDPVTARREEQFLSLAGTAVNCAGGVTPWGSWLSCEETAVAAPDTGLSHGWIFEVPAARRGLADPVPLKAMGRFRHEAAAVDPVTGIVYLTEDREDGLFYRFIPSHPGELARGGRLQALALPGDLRDSRNWTGAALRPGSSHAVRWIDLADVESPADDLRQRGHAAGAALFARGEGIHLGLGKDGAREFFFTCTSGGAGRFGQIFRLVTGAGATDQLELFVESGDPQLMDYADNLTVAPWGHLIVCEDRTGDKVNHLKGVSPEGKIYTVARLNAETELAGACFSPDGSILFVNAYAPGRTLAIRGPWRSVGGAGPA